MGVTKGLEFRATVTDIREESRAQGRVRWQLQLDRTEFAKGDVGVLYAVSRNGAILEVPVLHITVENGGEVWHAIEKPLATGTEVTGRVDGTKR